MYVCFLGGWVGLVWDARDGVHGGVVPHGQKRSWMLNNSGN